MYYELWASKDSTQEQDTILFLRTANYSEVAKQLADMSAQGYALTIVKWLHEKT